MVIDLTENTSNSRTENKSSRYASIQSRQKDAAIFCGNKISNNAIMNREKDKYAWTRIREPANKPVKDLQIMSAHIE